MTTKVTRVLRASKYVILYTTNMIDNFRSASILVNNGCIDDVQKVLLCRAGSEKQLKIEMVQKNNILASQMINGGSKGDKNRLHVVEKGDLAEWQKQQIGRNG